MGGGTTAELKHELIPTTLHDHVYLLATSLFITYNFVIGLTSVS